MYVISKKETKYYFPYLASKGQILKIQFVDISNAWVCFNVYIFQILVQSKLFGNSFYYIYDFYQEELYDKIYNSIWKLVQVPIY